MAILGRSNELILMKGLTQLVSTGIAIIKKTQGHLGGSFG